MLVLVLVRALAALTITVLGGCSLIYPLGDDLVSVSASDAAAPDSATSTGDAAPPASPYDDGGGPADGPTSRYAKAVLDDAPIVYLRLGESAGPTALNLAGPGGTYAVTGVTLGAPGALAGDTDTAVTFTDGSGAISMPPGAEFDGLAPFSVEVCVKPSASNTSLGFTIDHEAFSGGRRGWLLRTGETGFVFERWDEPTGRAIGSPAPPATGVWQHVVGVFDGTRAYLFVDGSLVSQDDIPLPIPVRGNTYSIARQNSGGSGNSFRGDLDELAIYDKALTGSRIAAHYAAAK